MMKNKSYMQKKVVSEEKGSKEQLKEFLTQYATDDKLYNAETEQHKMIFTAGFIRGVAWVLKKGNNEEEIKKALSNMKKVEKTSMGFHSKEEGIKKPW